MVIRKKPDDLRDKRPVLDAMGRCRKAIIAAQDQVTPFGPTYKALEPVKAAIKAAAFFLTGNDTFYSAPGSAPGSGRDKWEDSGSM